MFSKALFLLTCPALVLQASVIISNYPYQNGNGGTTIDTNNGLESKAAGFTMPAGLVYMMDSATVRLAVSDTSAVVRWALYGGASGPQYLVSDLYGSNLTAGSSDYLLRPVGGALLRPGETYWLVERGMSGGINALRWVADSSPGQTPTGLATSAGYLFNGSGGLPDSASSIQNIFEVRGTEFTPHVAFGNYAPQLNDAVKTQLPAAPGYLDLATGFTVPEGEDYWFRGLSLRLTLGSGGSEIPKLRRGSPNGEVVANLITTPFHNGTGDRFFFPAEYLLLRAGESYWIDFGGSVSGGIISWNAGGTPGIGPTGAFQSLGYMTSTDGSNYQASNLFYSFELFADALAPAPLPPPSDVPEPATVLLALVGLGSCWILRKKTSL
ncbi:MAG: choice-of-anchor R domain-containing protein [Bryobacteraceae bacterium]